MSVHREVACSQGAGVPGPGGAWSWGVPCPRGSGPGGCLVPGGAWSRGVPGGDPPDGYCCGRYTGMHSCF